ncbi:MAG: DUF2298 domain-containing protein [Oscillochloridaceae bacterium umkhey_bin13]
MLAEVLTWWLVASLLGLAGAPLALHLFAGLPDRGHAAARPLGLLLSGYLAWLLAMLGLAAFSAGSLVAAALIVFGLGLWVLGGPGPVLARVRTALPTRWPALLASEAIFLLALLAVVWMRAHDPNPWGTERPMDFAFFNAVQRSGLFPPNDPWLAGFSLNYYYFGYLLTGGVALLSGLAPAVAYNLSLALIFAMTAQGIANLIANLMLLTTTPTTRPSRAVLALFPLLGVILVLVAGNQSGLLQIAVGSERIVALNANELATALQQSAANEPFVVLPEPITTPGDAWGSFDSWERRDQWANFNWWWPSRSLWDTYPGGDRRYAITEFPLFSFRLGDMHPHVMALPFGLLAMSMALATMVRPGLPGLARPDQIRLLLTGLLIGSLYTLNSWDLPAYLLLYSAVLAVIVARDGLPRLALLRPLLIVVAAAYLLFLPFHLTFRSLVGSAAPLIDLPILGRITSIIGPYLAERTSLLNFVVIFGLFFLPVLTMLGLAGRSAPSFADAPAGLLQRLLHPLSLILILFGLGLAVGFPLIGLAGLGLLALTRAVALADQPGLSFGLLLAALGCAIVFGVELIYIRDVFEGWSARFNTVFKFYYQVWLIWGTLAPFALWWSLRYATGWLRPLVWASATLSAALLIGALVYPWLALGGLGRGEMQGLHGRTPRELSSAGAASIEWLRRNAAPGSVVLEGVALLNRDAVANGVEAPRCGGSYNPEGYGGVSAATGLPTILGWHGHQVQWRGGDPLARAELEPRCSDVDTIYRSPDPTSTRALLERYNVRYIYLGGLERATYPPEALAKFDQLGEPVFAQDEVTIYQVR